MSSVAAIPSTRRNRLWRITITGVLMGIAFVIGVAITAFVAIRMFLSIAVLGLLGIASAGPQAATSALYSGDSATRLTVLTQLKETFDAQPTTTLDAQTAAWMLPAVEHCKTDMDPEVAKLAEELASHIKNRTTESQ